MIADHYIVMGVPLDKRVYDEAESVKHSLYDRTRTGASTQKQPSQVLAETTQSLPAPSPSPEPIEQAAEDSLVD